MSNSIILEKLSAKQLWLLLAANLFVMVLLVVGGGQGPRPTNAMTRITKTCNDKYSSFENHTKPIDDDSCTDKVPSIAVDDPTLIGNNIVFYVVLPTDMYPEIRMSRWFQWMIGLMQLRVRQDPRVSLSNKEPVVTFKAAIFGRSGAQDIWRPVHSMNPEDVHSRRVTCTVDPEYEVTDCSDFSLFELGSVYYAQYLINIQLPERDGFNRDVPRLDGIDITEIHQNGGFTKVWVAQKTVLFPLLLTATILFARQVKQCNSSPLLVTRVIQGLGVVNAIYNLPLEYISLFADVPHLRVWYDCCSGMFYAATAVLWLLFVGEHRMDLDQRNKFSNYWKEITSISICCGIMFLFDIIERGLQTSDPFHSIWSTASGEKTAHMLLIVSAICASFYFLVLLYLMVRAVLSMSRKRASLVNVGRVRQMYYEGLITRFKLMVYGTVICGLITVVMFILININEMYYKWGRTEDQIQISSGFLVGMAGLWNLYVLNVLFLYAPTKATTTTEEYQTIEMSEVDVAKAPDALHALTKPAAD